MSQSVQRTLNVLETLVRQPANVSLSQLSTTLDLPPGTVHRLLATLIERGYASQNKVSRQYGPGPKLLEIGAMAARNQRFDLRQIVRPCLEELTHAISETSNLVVLQDLEIVYVDQVVSPRLVRMLTEVGCRAPLYCTGGGKSILAQMTEHQLEAYLAATPLWPLTPRTLATPQALQYELERIRQHGYAIDDEEREEGVRCVAAPIFDHMGNSVAALSISGPISRLPLERLHELGRQVRASAQWCSQQLGFQQQPVPLIEV